MWLAIELLVGACTQGPNDTTEQLCIPTWVIIKDVFENHAAGGLQSS